VTVCPTGIDIRNGIQLECINCTACMDACDDVMRRVRRRVGLIRLTSSEAVRTGRTTWLTARVKAYAVVWAALAASVVILLLVRHDLDVLILRQPGTLYATVEGGTFANFYDVQVINRTARPHLLEYRVVWPPDATLTPLGPIAEIAPHGLVESRVLVNVPQDRLEGPATPIRFEVRSNGDLVDTIESSFLGPGK
jgi:polyferredoxin